jgi:hypothetical protein
MFPPIELPDLICQHKGLNEAEWLLCATELTGYSWPGCGSGVINLPAE